MNHWINLGVPLRSGLHGGNGMKRIILGVALLGTTAAAEPHGAPMGVPAQTKALDDMVACRSVTDATQRLACFDEKVGALQDATARHDIVVVNRQEVRDARRSLFGFTLPSLRIFGDSDQGKPDATEPEEKEITATIRSARQDGAGNWIVILEDGAIWHQTDGAVAVGPKPGMQVTIRKAALGSYFMRVGKQPGVKARRES